jgi:hypothetical protein
MAMVLAAAAAPPAFAQGPIIPGQNPQAKAAAEAKAPDLNADGTVPTAIAKAGVRTHVGSAWDCALPDRAPTVWARADHGTIIILAGTGPQCGRPSVKQAGIFYTSEPGFKGTDKIYVLGFLASGNINNIYTVLVK